MPISYLRASLLEHLPQVLRDLGVEPDAVFTKMGLSSNTIRSADNLLSTQQAYELIQTAKALTGCQHLGLLIGGALTTSSLGPSVAMMQASPTFLHAIKEGLKYVKLNAPDVHRELHIEGDTSYLSNTLDIVDGPLNQEIIQLSVSAIWRVHSLASSNQWHPKAICFTFPPPADRAAYKRFFQIPVIFNSDFNGVTFETSDLSIELNGRDEALHDMLQDYLTIIENEIPSDFIASIKSLIRKRLNAGTCSIDEVVEYLPYEKRAFQRKLKEKGESYQGILDEVRFEKAIEHLTTSNMSMSRLSELLCYKNVSVFSKAFKKKFGVSPQAWKKKNTDNLDQ